MKYKNIVFDVGDVLISYRWQEMLMDYGLSQDEATRVGTMLFEDKDLLWSRFDKGEFTEEQLIERYCEKYPKDKDAIRFFIHHGEYMHVPRPKVWEQVHRLKEKGYGIYILSNYSEVLFKKHTRYADFLDDVDGMLVSYMVKLAKPDVKIYEELFERFHIKPEECLFFDDRKENVEAAKNLRMDSIQVLSKEQLIEELKRL